MAISGKSYDEPMMKLIPMLECVTGRVYLTHCRNLLYGVYAGDGGFIGIRKKFEARYLFTEYHRDRSKHCGTVYGTEDTGIDVPKDIVLTTSTGSLDDITKRAVAFDKPVADGGKGWYFLDTGKPSIDIRAYSAGNIPLFKYLDTLEREQRGIP